MTPEQEKIINEWIKRIKRIEGWLEERDASLAFVESAREHIRMLKSQLVDVSPEQENAKKVEEVEKIKTQLADERMRPFLLTLVENWGGWTN